MVGTCGAGPNFPMNPPAAPRCSATAGYRERSARAETGARQICEITSPSAR
jgi:hypothetical protein